MRLCAPDIGGGDDYLSSSDPLARLLHYSMKKQVGVSEDYLHFTARIVVLEFTIISL